MHRLPYGLAAVAVAVLLSGCTAAPGGGAATTGGDSGSTGTLTTSQACAAVSDAVSDAVDGFQRIDPADPTAAGEAFDDLAASLADAAAAVPQGEVGALLPRLQRDFAQAAEIMAAIAGGDLGRVADLQQPTQDIQDAFGEFAALCR